MGFQRQQKIKIWLWLIWHNAFATKDNIFKRGWRGDLKCRFCDEEESIHHLFFLCPAKNMWRVVSLAIGAADLPGNFAHYFDWIARYARNFIIIHVFLYEVFMLLG
jgi:hypothetical protein